LCASVQSVFGLFNGQKPSIDKEFYSVDNIYMIFVATL
jgi:hypothetical protein